MSGPAVYDFGEILAGGKPPTTTPAGPVPTPRGAVAAEVRIGEVTAPTGGASGSGRGWLPRSRRTPAAPTGARPRSGAPGTSRRGVDPFAAPVQRPLSDTAMIMDVAAGQLGRKPVSDSNDGKLTDTYTVEGGAMFGMLEVLAEFQRELIVANASDGLPAARPRPSRRPEPTTDPGSDRARIAAI